MTATNLRGAYPTFTHDRQPDWDWLAAWQPNVIRLMMQGNHDDASSVDVGRIRRVHETCPGATLLLRVWDVDDRTFAAHREMRANPQAEADRQHSWWARLFDRVQGVPRHLLMAGSNNEPDTRDNGNAVLTYNQRLAALGTRDAMRYGLYCFSVGNPAKDGEHEFDWRFYRQIEEAALAGHHAIVLHEYMQPEGMYGVWTDGGGAERRDWRSLMGRHLESGLTRADIIIGEWGLDGLLFNRFPNHNKDADGNEYGNSGWRDFPATWPAERMADEYVAYIGQCAPNVIGVCPFLSDEPAPKWHSFDIAPAYGALLARKGLTERSTQSPPRHTIFLPSVPNQDTPQPPSQTTPDNWARAHLYVLAFEGGLSLDPKDRGNYYNGQLVGTKYGISAAVWGNQYDIRNLTIEQALAIYKEHYWRASGADTLPWPMCLIHLDTAVNAGVWRANQLLAQAHGDPALYLLRRLQWYQSLEQWQTYGRAWANRVYKLADVLADR